MGHWRSRRTCSQDAGYRCGATCFTPGALPPPSPPAIVHTLDFQCHRTRKRACLDIELAVTLTRGCACRSSVPLVDRRLRQASKWTWTMVALVHLQMHSHNRRVQAGVGKARRQQRWTRLGRWTQRSPQGDFSICAHVYHAGVAFLILHGSASHAWMVCAGPG